MWAVRVDWMPLIKPTVKAEPTRVRPVARRRAADRWNTKLLRPRLIRHPICWSSPVAMATRISAIQAWIQWAKWPDAKIVQIIYFCGKSKTRSDLQDFHGLWSWYSCSTFMVDFESYVTYNYFFWHWWNLNRTQSAKTHEKFKWKNYLLLSMELKVFEAHVMWRRTLPNLQ